MRNLLYRFQTSLTDYRSLLPYAVLGIVGGFASALLILGFEQLIRSLALLWQVGEQGDGFESLPQWQHFALPAGGALLLGLIFQLLRPEDRETGIVHVLSRMHYNYGALPLRNALVQLFGGAFALATGQSGGREGPGVHLGGAVNSLLGQRLGLPNNSLRVLIACGTAGGIAVAFNTPLAGVIFAMEVIVLEYTVTGFVPVILAAVTAAAISHYLLGGGALFSMPPVALNSLAEMPLIALLGVACGCAVALFILIARLTASTNPWPVWLRFTLAGLLTGTIALLFPAVLGMGYDSLRLILAGQMAPLALLLLAGSKLLATSVSSGVGMPVGLIGPNLIIGACLGGLLGGVVGQTVPGLSPDTLLYVVIGMASAMAAVLNAPLAAILAVVELTQDVTIVMPAMLAIIAATLTNSEIFGQRSAHMTVLRKLQRQVPDDPLNQLLHRTHVSSSMEINVTRLDALPSTSAIDALLRAAPSWCLIEREQEALYLVRGTELAQWLTARREQAAATPAAVEAADATAAEPAPRDSAIDLNDAGIRRWTTTSVPVQATLRQAADAMRLRTAQAVCVYGRSDRGSRRALLGVVTQETIEKFTLSQL